MELIKELLGLGIEAKELTLIHVVTRGVIVFLASVIMVRLGDKRFLSRKSALDAVLGFILASMMARAVNGSGPLGPTLAGGFVMVLLHRAICHLALRSHRFGALFKGHSELVIENGELREEALRSNDFSRHDLEEDLRLNGVCSLTEVKLGYIERNGSLSVVRA